jgi:hypothetical protein
MLFLWILVAIWLAAAVLLPLHMLFKALFREGRRAQTSAERKYAMLSSRGY